MRFAFDVVIVGGGPAGCAAATLLARAGLAVALVEKQRFPRRKVCGECIAASNLPLLETLGIGEAFGACAGPELRRVALMRADACVIADLPAASGRSRWGRALGRETFDALLLENAAAAGARVWQPWQARAIAYYAEHVWCHLQNVDTAATHTLRARLLVAANGSWEPLPCARTAAEPRRARDLLAFKANFRDTNLAPGLLPVLSFDGGYGGMVVAEDGLATVACCVRRDRLVEARWAAPGRSAGDAVEQLLTRECAGVRDALRGARRAGPWLAAGPLRPGIRLRADDAWPRIGNAAGEAHPIIGEGISMALQSAFLLSESVLAQFANTSGDSQAWRRAIGARYAAQWRHAFMPRLLVAATFAHAAMRRSSGGLLMQLARMCPGLLTAGARWGGKARSVVDAQAMKRLERGLRGFARINAD